MSRIVIFPSSSKFEKPETYHDYENRWMCASEFIRWIVLMNKIGVPMAREPLPELLLFYDKLGREHHDWITLADKYVYYVSYVAEKCKYEVLRALEVKVAYEQVDETSTLRKTSKLKLDAIESFRNGQWVNVLYKPVQQDDEPDEIDYDAYMKVIGYA